MTSKAEARRRKKARQSEGTHSPQGTPTKTANAPSRPRTDGPTPQRKAKGAWAMPKGAEKHYMPAIDLASDIIGRLHVNRAITDSQEQAARTFEQLRRAYIAEMPDISGYKSCLDGGVPGFDDGEGNPEIIAQYRTVEAKLTRQQRHELLRVFDMGIPPGNLINLRRALDVVAGC